MAARKRAAANADRELVITRIFDAPPGLVFKAWTEPEHLARWQGAPQGFTVTTHQMDIRPGGAFRVCMRSPEDVDYWLEGVYREIEVPERLVFTHVWLDAEGNAGKETLVMSRSPNSAGRPSSPCIRPTSSRSSREMGTRRAGPAPLTASPSTWLRRALGPQRTRGGNVKAFRRHE
jgi:uncharacterized protein YndB with AHSA1/START domain